MKKTFKIRHTHDSYVMTSLTQCSLQEVLQFYVNHVSVNGFLENDDAITEKATHVFFSFTPKPTGEEDLPD